MFELNLKLDLHLLQFLKEMTIIIIIVVIIFAIIVIVVVVGCFCFRFDCCYCCGVFASCGSEAENWFLT